MGKALKILSEKKNWYFNCKIKKKTKGIITDGQIRRTLLKSKKFNFKSICSKKIMTKNPIFY